MLTAQQAGYIAQIDAERVGLASVRLGAGRQRKGDPIDHSVGFILQAKAGDKLAVGDPLIEIHARSQEEAQAIHQALLDAYHWSDQAPSLSPLILGSVSRETYTKEGTPQT
jgi:thymidine phosphorylase